MEDLKLLLLRSYDVPLSESESQKLKAALESSEALRGEKEYLDSVRTKIADFDTDFSPGFTGKLMQKITGEQGYDFLTIFRTVALSGVAAIILVLFTIYFVDGSLNLDSLLGINSYAPDLGVLSLF